MDSIKKLSEYRIMNKELRNSKFSARRSIFLSGSRITGHGSRVTPAFLVVGNREAAYNEMNYEA
jgi:hypothetical protein